MAKFLFYLLLIFVLYLLAEDVKKSLGLKEYEKRRDILSTSSQKPQKFIAYKSRDDLKALKDQGLIPSLHWPFLKQNVLYAELLCNQRTQNNMPIAQIYYLRNETRYAASEVTGNMYSYSKAKMKIANVWFENAPGISDNGDVIESIGVFANLDNKITYSYLQNLVKQNCKIL